MVRILIAVASALSLVACLGPGDPVELPEDTIEAARTCFAVEGLVMREGKSKDDPVSYEDFVAAIKYPMIAAAQTEPFSADTITKVLDGSDKVADEIRSNDYKGAVATCQARFAVDGDVALPEDESDAVLSCLAFAAYMQGAVQAQGGDFGEQGALIEPLRERLEERMQSDPAVLLKLASGDVDTVMTEAMKPAFAGGAPDEYIAQCAARFPAES